MQGADYNKLEAKMAAKDGARVVKNSGRGINKGDASMELALLDYKFTEAKSFSLNYEKWLKHEKDAFKLGKEGALVAVFQSYRDRRIAMVDFDWLLELMETKQLVEALREEITELQGKYKDANSRF